jgi:hypothetical protein
MLADQLHTEIEELIRAPGNERRRKWIELHPNLLRPETVERVAALQEARLLAGDFDEAAALAEAAYFLSRCMESDTHTMIADTERLSIKEIALGFSRWFRSPASAPLWEGTPYPQIAGAIQMLAHGMDGKSCCGESVSVL